MKESRYIIASDGVRLRTAVFTHGSRGQGRGVCVLLTGQTEFIEKYEEVIGELCARGFSVAALDWRGQGGSARLLPNPLKAHIDDFAQYDDDLTSFMQQIVQPLSAKPPLALAHSMGAHILLRALHDRPMQFAAAVLSAPMLRAQTRGYPAWFARALTFVQARTGRKSAWVLGMDKRDPLTMEFSDQLVTSDRARYARAKALVTGHPELRLAGPTWGWLEAGYSSMNRVMAPGYAEAIPTPVLICGAGQDRIVDTQAEREFVKRLPHGTYLELRESEHEILMEADAIRQQFWKAFDEFVASTLPWEGRKIQERSE
ncbi:MAG: alpha/beta hydrolase [Proteobacteria bacterium]|nr:alpha/beta hydrolase [Pseudomonadota bacterium]